MKALVSAAVVGCLASTAHAQAPGMTPPAEAPDEKSETVAAALTIAGIAVPGALAALALRDRPAGDDAIGALGTVGGLALIPLPSAGHWYAGELGLAGAGMRLLGLVSFMFGREYLAYGNTTCATEEFAPDACTQDSDRAVGIGAIALGVGAYATSIVYDVITSRREVRRWNAKHASGVMTMPLVLPRAAGVVVGVAF